MADRPFDPEVAHSFLIEIDGFAVLRATRAEGLTWETDTVTFHEGGRSEPVSLIGPGHYTPLKLKKGFFGWGNPFFEWLRASFDPSNKVQLAIHFNLLEEV